MADQDPEDKAKKLEDSLRNDPTAVEISEGDFKVETQSELGVKVMSIMTKMETALAEEPVDLVLNAVLNFLAHYVVVLGIDPRAIIKTFVLAMHIAADQEIEAVVNTADAKPKIVLH